MSKRLSRRIARPLLRSARDPLRSARRPVAALAAAAAMVGVPAGIAPLALAWGETPHVLLGAPPLEPPAPSDYSATLEQCISSPVPAQRSVTFAGQMTAVPGTQRMEMRIELQERIPGESAYHTVDAPGLGTWRGSEPGVKIYKYLKQITNLSAPASYRAVVHFHWVGAKGRVLRRAALRTSRCWQPLLSAENGGPGTQSSGSGTQSGGSGTQSGGSDTQAPA